MRHARTTVGQVWPRQTPPNSLGVLNGLTGSHPTLVAILAIVALALVLLSAPAIAAVQLVCDVGIALAKGPGGGGGAGRPAGAAGRRAGAAACLRVRAAARRRQPVGRQGRVGGGRRRRGAAAGGSRAPVARPVLAREQSSGRGGRSRRRERVGWRRFRLTGSQWECQRGRYEPGKLQHRRHRRRRRHLASEPDLRSRRSRSAKRKPRHRPPMRPHGAPRLPPMPRARHWRATGRIVRRASTGPRRGFAAEAYTADASRAHREAAAASRREQPDARCRCGRRAASRSDSGARDAAERAWEAVDEASRTGSARPLAPVATALAGSSPGFFQGSATRYAGGSPASRAETRCSRRANTGKRATSSPRRPHSIPSTIRPGRCSGGPNTSSETSAPPIITFKTALRRQPTWEGLHNGLGWSRLRLGRYQLAAAAFQSAARPQSRLRRRPEWPRLGPARAGQLRVRLFHRSRKRSTARGVL